MAKPNYGYEKRQRELAKKQKKEAKRLKKSGTPPPLDEQAMSSSINGRQPESEKKEPD